MSEARVMENQVKLYELQAGADRLYRLAFAERRFVPAAVTADEETATFCYDMRELTDGLSLEKATAVDKLRFLLNVGELAPLAGEFTFSLAPSNLCADRNLEPKIIRRDLRGSEGSFDFTEAYRALIGWLLRPKNTYEQYLGSGTGLYKKHKLLKLLPDCAGVEDIRAVLLREYEREQEKQRIKMRLVNRKQYKTMQILLPVFILLFLGSGGFAGYLHFYILPFQETLVAAEHSFLLEDYDAAITMLAPIAPMTMPKEER